MRLLVVTRNYPPFNGTRSLQIGKVVEAIKRTGVEVRVVAGLEKKTRIGDQGESVNGDVVYVPYCLRDGYGFVDRTLHFVDNEIGSINHLDGWVRRSKAAALKQCETFRPDCLLTSSTPFKAHLIGLHVKRSTGLPWIASFSDPWPRSLCPRPHYREPVFGLGRMTMVALARVIEACDAVHMPSRHGIEWTAAVSGLPVVRKGVAIPHIGLPVQAGVATHQYAGWLAHVGHLSRERASVAVLRGVETAYRQFPQRFNGLLCVGQVCPKFRDMVRDMGLDHIVRFTGKLAAAQAAAVLLSVTASLVIEADMEISPFLPSKFADYALAGKPIIAVTPPRSGIRDYLTHYGGGRAVGHDAEQIADAIRSVFARADVDGLAGAGVDGQLAEVFSPTTVGNQYRELVARVVAGKVDRTDCAVPSCNQIVLPSGPLVRISQGQSRVL